MVCAENYEGRKRSGRIGHWKDYEFALLGIVFPACFGVPVATPQSLTRNGPPPSSVAGRTFRTALTLIGSDKFHRGVAFVACSFYGAFKAAKFILHK